MAEPVASRRDAIVLVAVVAVAILVRLPSLLHGGIWRDDALVYVDVTAPSFREFLARAVAIEYHPPLYFLLAYGWEKLAGFGETPMNLLPFVFGIATVPLAYVLGRDADSPETGLLAAAIYAVAPLAVTYSDEYVYAFAAFTFALFAWAVLGALGKPPSPARMLGVAGAAALCVYSHYTALFFVPMVVVWVLACERDAGRRIALIAAIGAGAASFALWLPSFLAQERVGIPYQGGMSIGEKAMGAFAHLLLYVPAWSFESKLAMLAFLIAAIALVRPARIPRNAAALGLMSLAALAVIDFSDKLLALRYVAPFYPLFCVFVASIAVAFVRTAGRDLHLPRAGAIALAALLPFVTFAFDARAALEIQALPKSGIRTFTESRPLDRNTLYVLAPDYIASTFAFYSRGSNVTYRGFVRYDDPEALRLRGYARDWNRPDAVASAVAAIAAEAPAYRCLDVVVDATARDQAGVPYGKSWELLRALERRFALVDRTAYAARWEPVVVYRLASGRCPPAA